jgi:hypothetical protein
MKKKKLGVASGVELFLRLKMASLGVFGLILLSLLGLGVLVSPAILMVLYGWKQSLITLILFWLLTNVVVSAWQRNGWASLETVDLMKKESFVTLLAIACWAFFFLIGYIWTLA